MHLPLFIAFRYLFAKKSHNVINIISIISAVGIGIGSMALIVILSVYNGFDNLIKDLYESYEADYIITPIKGKTFEINSSSLSKIKNINGISAICPVIEENVFIKYGDNKSIATIKGIDTAYQRVSSISKNIVEGEFKTMIGQIPHAIVGQKLAQDLMLRVRFLTPIELYFPDRDKEISLVNPMSSLRSEKLFSSGIIRLEQNFDKKYIFAPLTTVRNLIGYYNAEATSVEIYLPATPQQGRNTRQYKTSSNTIGEEIQLILGNEYVVKDRFRQNETLYKMMTAEKFTVYFILFFVILIISINIFSSLSMLIIDKKDDINTF
ncbi:MAG: ABC transporter permease, partial [Bacteroidales bacterium]